MIKLFKKHFKAIKKRGLITHKTTDRDFHLKAIEELQEWIDSNDPQEAIDTVNVLTNWLQLNDYDIYEEQLVNVEHQQTRLD